MDLSRCATQEDRRMSNVLYLHASSLFSKWGFGDGDALWDWYWDATGGDVPADMDDDDTLELLVRAALIPAIEAAGHTIELERIGTIHNPLRARTLDGQPVPDAVIYGDTPHPAWADDIYVAVTLDTLRALTTERTDS